MDQMTFGILCLALAAILILIYVLRRLIKAIQRHRRHTPDLRERAAGGGYRHRRGGRRYGRYRFGADIPSYRGKRR